MDKKLSQNSSIQNKLLEKLSNCKAVSKYDNKKNQEADTLLHCFLDSEKSFRNIFDKWIPKIIEAKDESEVKNLLLEIGEELRHILYHINGTIFFEYLKEDIPTPHIHDGV